MDGFVGGVDFRVVRFPNSQKSRATWPGLEQFMVLITRTKAYKTNKCCQSTVRFSWGTNKKMGWNIDIPQSFVLLLTYFAGSTINLSLLNLDWWFPHSTRYIELCLTKYSSESVQSPSQSETDGGAPLRKYSYLSFLVFQYILRP